MTDVHPAILAWATRKVETIAGEPVSDVQITIYPEKNDGVIGIVVEVSGTVGGVRITRQQSLSLNGVGLFDVMGEILDQAGVAR